MAGFCSCTDDIELKDGRRLLRSVNGDTVVFAMLSLRTTGMDILGFSIIDILGLSMIDILGMFSCMDILGLFSCMDILGLSLMDILGLSLMDMRGLSMRLLLFLGCLAEEYLRERRRSRGAQFSLVD